METHLLHRSLRHSSQTSNVRLADNVAVPMSEHSRRAAARGNLIALRRWSGIISLQSWHLNIVLIEFGVVIWDQCRSFDEYTKVKIIADIDPGTSLRSLEPTAVT